MITTISKIKLEQKRIIFKIKKYINKEYSADNNFFYKEHNYFINWAETEGKFKLISVIKNLINFTLIDRLKFFFKKIINQEQDYEIIDNSKINNNYNNLVFSYFSKNDFVNSTIIDRFFSDDTSSNKKTLWVMLYQGSDKITINRRYKNIIILKKKKLFNNKIYFFLLIFRFLLSSKKINFKKNKLYSCINLILDKIINNNKISFFFYPFESQPLQHYIKFLVNKINPSIKCFAYLHTALPALPTEFILPEFTQHNLISHGNENKIILKKLGWNNKNFIINKSFRYKKRNKNFFRNKIFLPYDFKDSLYIFDQIKKIINHKKLNIYSSFEIVNHPFMINSKKHLDLIKNLNEIMIDNKYNVNNFCVCVGSTATIIESLENGVDVVHLVNEPIFEVYTSLFWTHLKTNILEKNIFHYLLKKKNSYINFGTNNEFSRFQNKIKY